jgi:hypothetical protein
MEDGSGARQTHNPQQCRFDGWSTILPLLYVQPLMAGRSTTQAILDRGSPYASEGVVLWNLWVFKDCCTSTQYYGYFNAKVRQH